MYVRRTFSAFVFVQIRSTADAEDCDMVVAKSSPSTGSRVTAGVRREKLCNRPGLGRSIERAAPLGSEFASKEACSRTSAPFLASVLVARRRLRRQTIHTDKAQTSSRPLMPPATPATTQTLALALPSDSAPEAAGRSAGGLGAVAGEADALYEVSSLGDADGGAARAVKAFVDMTGATSIGSPSAAVAAAALERRVRSRRTNASLSCVSLAMICASMRTLAASTLTSTRDECTPAICASKEVRREIAVESNSLTLPAA